MHLSQDSRIQKAWTGVAIPSVAAILRPSRAVYYFQDFTMQDSGMMGSTSTWT